MRRTITLFLLSLFTTVWLNATAQEDARTWQVFLRRDVDATGTDRLIFVEALTGDQVEVEVFGERYTDDVVRVMESVRDNPVTIAKSANATGKSQPVNTPVLTMAGYVPIGSVQVGDEVIGDDRKPHTVIGVFPQGKQPTFRVSFNDDSETYCSEDHLWNVRSASDKYRRRPYQTMTTGEVAKILHRFIHIPMCFIYT